jgi:hypothetical protein
MIGVRVTGNGQSETDCGKDPPLEPPLSTYVQLGNMIAQKKAITADLRPMRIHKKENVWREKEREREQRARVFLQRASQ